MAQRGARWWTSFDADDPRHQAILADLEAVVGRGRHSPAARMLAEWAVLGHALWRGQIPIAGPGAGVAPALPPNLPDPTALAREREQIAAAVRELGGFDE